MEAERRTNSIQATTFLKSGSNYCVFKDDTVKERHSYFARIILSTVNLTRSYLSRDLPHSHVSGSVELDPSCNYQQAPMIEFCHDPLTCWETTR
jgi:hypothetical protein